MKSLKVEVISLYDFYEMLGLKEMEAPGTWCESGVYQVCASILDEDKK